MDQIENLAKSGNKDKAEELLSQLEQMMNNLQAGRQPAAGPERPAGEMRRQDDKLGRINAGASRDDEQTFRMIRCKARPAQRGQNVNEQLGQGGEVSKAGRGAGQSDQGMSPGGFRRAAEQLCKGGPGSLRGDLQTLMQTSKASIKPGQGLGEAGRRWAMPRRPRRRQGDEAVGRRAVHSTR